MLYVMVNTGVDNAPSTAAEYAERDGRLSGILHACIAYILHRKGIVCPHRLSDIWENRRSMTGHHKVRYSYGRFPKYRAPRPVAGLRLRLTDGVSTETESNAGPFQKIPNV